MIVADQIDGDGCITKQELKTFLKRFLKHFVFLIVAALGDLSQNLRPCVSWTVWTWTRMDLFHLWSS